jgi:hypothetical protein
MSKSTKPYKSLFLRIKTWDLGLVSLLKSLVAMVLPCEIPQSLWFWSPFLAHRNIIQLCLNKIHASSFVTKNIKKHQSSLNSTTIYTKSKASGFWNPLLQRRKSTENRRKIHGWPSNNSRSAPFWALPSTCSKGQPQGLQGLQHPSRTCLPGATNSWAFSGMVY